MKILLAPDSFKESMTAVEAAEAMERGVRRIYPNAECVKLPFADGGEGTAECLVMMTGGEMKTAAVTGPLGETVHACYGIINGDTAVIETAECCGLPITPPDRRDPRITTSYGVGELIFHVMEQGIHKLIVGLGGSATNDGGAGMLAALGAVFTDAKGRSFVPAGGSLGEIAGISFGGLDSRLKELQITIASDVTNPLTGRNGASYVYARQKGADDAMIPVLEDGMRHYAALLEQHFGKTIAEIPGAGAAGGLGAAFFACLGAHMESGVELLLRLSGMAEKLAGADYVFTGEGSVDAQSAMGKTPCGIARLASTKGVPTIIFAGRVRDGLEPLYQIGVNGAIAITPPGQPLEEALKNGAVNMENAVAGWLEKSQSHVR